MIKLTDKEFETITGFLKSHYGINLINKRQLIESRMYSTLVEKGFSNFTDYFELIMKQKDSSEITAMLNKLTTNHTYLMREPVHFDFYKNVALPQLTANNPSRELRIWSAGCSSGEEAYTTVMVTKDFLGPQAGRWDYSILATDISEKVMSKAKLGLFPEESLKGIPSTWKTHNFRKSTGGNYELIPEIRKEVIFRYFNLMDNFVFRKPFDIIFCRNVMIYFDQQTKNNLINKFYEVLRPGGYLFIGLSETVQRDVSRFEYVQPSIYRRGVK